MNLMYKSGIFISIITIISILGLYSHLNTYNNGFIKGKDYVIDNTLIKDKKVVYVIKASCGGW